MQCNACSSTNPPDARFCNQCGSVLQIDAQSSEISQASRQAAKKPSAEASKSAAKLAPAQAPKQALAKPAASSYTPAHLRAAVLNKQAVQQGERKQVTVLFVDIQNSVELSELVEAERWHEVLDDFFNLLGTAIHRYEGTINQYTGDGVMALFGAPIAFEDHAVRAGLAALALREACRSFAAELRAELGINFVIRVGMNSGTVIVGAIGDDLRSDYTAQGATVGLAARMESIAAANSICLTEATARLVEGYLHCEALGAVNIKGQAEPVATYELVSEGSQQLRIERSQAQGLSAFVGRQAELAELQQHLAKVKAASTAAASESPDLSSQAVAVVGDAGIGKSRLCLEFVQQQAATGHCMYRSSGLPYAEALPLLPVRDLFRDLLGLSRNEAPRMARQKVAGALALLTSCADEHREQLFTFLDIAERAGSVVNDSTKSQAAAAESATPELQQQSLLRLFCALLREQQAEPVIILLEDWHWFDRASQAFFIAAITETQSPCNNAWQQSAEATEPVQSQGHAVFWLLNARPAGLSGVAEQADSLNLNAEITLKPLDASAMQSLLNSLLGFVAKAEHPAYELCQQMAAQAAGNPFYIEEAVRMLAEQGVLHGRAGHYEFTAHVQQSNEQLAVPASVEALVAGRIDRLAEEAKQLLLAAAIIGQEFTLAGLAQLLQQTEATLKPSLAALQAAAYLRAKAHNEWQFVHPLTQEIAYRSQLKRNRKRLHERYAGYLEAQLEQQIAETRTQQGVERLKQPKAETRLLAHHWQQADEPMKAAYWLVESISWLQQNSPGEALTANQTVLSLLEPLPDSDERHRLMLAARASIVRLAVFSAPDKALVQSAFAAAKQAVEQRKDQLGLAELLISYANYQLQGGDADVAVASVQQAMGLAHAEHDHELESRLRVPILLAHYAAGRLSEGVDLLTGPHCEAWLDGPITEANMVSRAFYALYYAAQSQLDLAMREITDCLSLAEQAGRSVSWMHVNHVLIAHQLGQREQLLAQAGLAVQAAENYGSSYFKVLAYRALVLAYLANHKLSLAQPIIEQLEHWVTKQGIATQFASELNAQRGRYEHLLGESTAAASSYQRAITIADQNNGRIDALQARLGLVAVLLDGENSDNKQIVELLAECEVLVKRTTASSYQAQIDEARARMTARRRQTPAQQA